MSKSIEKPKTETELAAEVADLQKRLKALEETVMSMKLKLAKKWI
jgi:uncharacterized protein YlxW (UPF0749 family)